MTSDHLMGVVRRVERKDRTNNLHICGGVDFLYVSLFLVVHVITCECSFKKYEHIDQTLPMDRPGSAICEHVLSLRNEQLHIHPKLNFKQIIAIWGWYLWWIRRCITHDESVPPRWRWYLSVISVASNHEDASTQPSRTPEAKWSKQDPRFIKLNVDAAFFPR